MNTNEIFYGSENINFFETNMTYCTYCGYPLFNSYHTAAKTIKTLKGIVKAKHVVKECTNVQCISRQPKTRNFFYSEKFLSFTLPHCAIGIDITLYIGFHMHLKSQSLDDVQKDLHLQGVDINRSSVYRHYERYLEFMAELSQQDIAEIKKEMEKNGGYILSIDAVYGIDSPRLLVCRDILSKKALRTKLINSEDDAVVIEILTEVKAMFGVPLAIISDMGTGISKGILTIFPDVKQQYCHFHFLKNLGKDLLEDEYQVIQQKNNNFKKKSKKLVKICQNNIEKAFTNVTETKNQEINQTLKYLQEGLITFISKVPSGSGFPFDLPAVNYSLKVITSKIFFDEIMTNISDKGLDSKLLSSLQDIQKALNEYDSSDIQKNLNEIELLYGNFVQLRSILENEDFSSNEIKNEIKSFLHLLKSQQNEHPMLEVIPTRLRKYWRNLFFCYDDKRIPRTNLDIEHSFNRLKRIKRKRTGVKIWPSYFTHEARSLIQIENITDAYKDDFSDSRFIEDFTAKILLVSKEQLEKQSIIRDIDKSFLKSNYHRKIPLLEAELTFEKLADKMKQI